jgi:hypothetical protein
MFFKSYLLSIADCLQARYEGMQRKGQNPVDKGELCETFVKEFLTDCLSDQFKIFRGGKIINIDNNESKQLDIVLTSRNSLKIFGDKGIYPIESAFAVFSITATLSWKKLEECINEFESIPKQNPCFEFHLVDPNQVLQKWQKLFPFKCIFGFTGDICQAWEDRLNGKVSGSPHLKTTLPDLIIVNKKGVIVKVDRGVTAYTTGGYIDKDFHFTDFRQNPNYHYGLLSALNRLFYLSYWQNYMYPKYYEYLNKDLQDNI